MSYRIMTDSSCDFPQQMYDELKLSYIPLSINYNGEEVTHYDEKWLKDQYAGQRAGKPATTAAANPADWASIMEPALKDGDDLLILAFSS